MKTLKPYTAYLLLIFLWACKTTDVSGPKYIISGGQDLNETYYSFPTPRTSHPPGYIYSTSKKNKGHWHQATLEPNDSIYIKNFSWELYESNYEVSSNFLAKFLGFNLGTIEHKKNKTYKIKFKAEDCLLESYTALELKKLISDASFNFNPQEKYYVIASAIKAKSVRITLETKDFNALNSTLNNQLNNISGEVKLDNSNESNIIISKEFNKHHRILYRPARINSRGILSNSGEKILIGFEDIQLIGD